MLFAQRTQLQHGSFPNLITSFRKQQMKKDWDKKNCCFSFGAIANTHTYLKFDIANLRKYLKNIFVENSSDVASFQKCFFYISCNS